MHSDLPPTSDVIALPSRALEKATESDRELAQSILRPHLKLFCENIVIGLRMRERNAMNNYARVLKLFEPDLNLILVLTKELGVGSLEEARTAITATAQARPIADNPEAMARRMLEWLEDYFRPQRKRIVILSEDDAT